jgi:hypothetical protein
MQSHRESGLTWSPACEGHLADRLYDRLDSVVRALSQCQPDEAPAYTLAQGAAGLAVCFKYLATSGVVLSASNFSGLAGQWFDVAAERLASARSWPSLFEGYLGVGWAAHYLSGPDAETASVCSEIDSHLLASLRDPDWRPHFDLLHGLSGALVYVSCRAGSATSTLATAEILTRISGFFSEPSVGAGKAVFSSRALLREADRERFPDGYYNTGMAHGAAGLVAAICMVERGALLHSDALADAGATLDWLESMAIAAPGKRYPKLVEPSGVSSHSCGAWCYGDPGIALALLHFGRCSGAEYWISRAKECALSCTLSPEQLAQCTEPGLCHGASGLGLIFSRLANYLNSEPLREIGRGWFENLLTKSQGERRYGGFTAVGRGPNNEFHAIDDPGLLNGACGIAMAITAAITSAEPQWDRTMLLST